MKTAIDQLNKDERSLLLYLETLCVDQSGVITDERMNATDWANLAIWEKEGFVQYRLRGDERIRGRNHVVRLSPTAWRMAHALRIDRADREARTHADIWGE